MDCVQPNGKSVKSYAAWRAHLLTRVGAPISATVRMSRLFNAQLQPPEFPHPRLP